MSLRSSVIQKIGQTKNVFTYGLLNFILRERFFKAFYGCLRGRAIDWQSKQACFSLSFDYDFREDVKATPAILEVLDKHGIKASFACIGKLIEQYPDIHRTIIEAGHEIINHTYTHPPSEELGTKGKFHKLSIQQQREEIELFHKVCEDILGYEPTGFRLPHFGGQHTDSIYAILRELGYSYSSSLKAIRSPDFGLPFYTKEGILELPVTTCPKHPINAFDTWHAFHVGKHSEEEFYELFKQMIEVGIDCSAYMNLYLDPRDVANNPVFDQVLALLRDKQDKLHVTKYEDLVSTVSACY